MSKTLLFQTHPPSLLERGGVSFSLGNEADLSKSFDLSNFPFHPDHFNEVDLGDLPCRLSAGDLKKLLEKVWASCEEGATVQVRLPHPRSDAYFGHVDYVRPLLAEAFSAFDFAQQNRLTGILADFETINVEYELDPYWHALVTRKEINESELGTAAAQLNNVVTYTRLTLKVRKSLLQTSLSPYSRQVADQLANQHRQQLSRGNKEAAEAIERWLALSNEELPK